MEVQDARKARLREVYTALQSEELSGRLNWSRGANLVADGIRLVSQYGDQIESDPELQEMGRDM